MKAIPLISGGKDSIYATYIALQQGFEIERILTVHPKDRYSPLFHVPNTHLVRLQAEAMEVNIVELSTDIDNEIECLIDFLEGAEEEFVVVGVISSEYQFSRMLYVCEASKKRLYAPLWRKNALNLIREILAANVEFIIDAVSAEGLTKDMLGLKIGRNEIELLESLSVRYGINPAGEGGEFETLVVNAPIFKKRIAIEKGNVIWKISHGYYIVEDARLV